MVIALLLAVAALPMTAQAGSSPQAHVVRSLKVGVSPAVRDLPKATPQEEGKPAEIREINEQNADVPARILNAEAPSGAVDPAVQNFHAPNAMPPPDMNFEGVPNINGVYPPDTQGDVGVNYYVQWVNLSFDIYDKTTGTSAIGGPVAGNSLWAGFGGSCQSTNAGDPITLYDHLAGRWLMSQFTFDNHQCIAVSQTGDPTGSWWLYDFVADAGLGYFNDYPKFGVWPDGYYFTANMFGDGSAMAGVFERDQMLNGNPAQFIWFFTPDTNALPSYSQLPADLDGGTLPPTGAPNPFVQLVDDAWGYDPPYDQDEVLVIPFHVDWSTPANSTYGPPTIIDMTAAGLPFDTNMCGYNRNCIPQPGTAQGLDALSSRLMYRLQYRNFGDHETLVTSHTVDVDGSDHAGVRWYELRDSGGGWTLEQGGTYAPDSDNRWMGDAAMDISGDIAVGFSVSSSTTYPSVGWAGRLAGDPAGTLAQGEDTVIAGSGSQTGSGARWGDYSAMSVDPTDDCTFWYTQEYMPTTGTAPWQTRIASFKFPSCSAGPSGIVEGTVIDSVTMAPIADAMVEVGAYSTSTDGSGLYSIGVPVGTYDVTASKFGYIPQTATDIEVIDETTTIQDFALDPAPTSVLDGYVTDAAHGWPLYAKINVAMGGNPVAAIFTNPFNGYYEVELPENAPYDLMVDPMFPGYWGDFRAIMLAPGGQIESFMLNAITPLCIAPGYGMSTGIALYEDFEGGFPPAGWSVTNEGGNCVWVGNDPGGRGNLTGGSGAFAVADSDECGPSTTMNTHMLTPILDVSGMHTMIFEFKFDYNNLSSGEVAAVDMRVGNSLSAPAPVPNSPMDEIVVRDIPAGHENDLTAAALPAADLPEAAPLAAGDVINSWAHGLALGWGVGFDKTVNNVWVANPGAGGGDDLDHEYTPAGTATGNTYNTSAWMGSWAGDMAYDSLAGTMWQLAVGGDNCIHEWDPTTQTTTGAVICFGATISERGLAYDPISDTFFVGGWNTYTITRFDRSGTVLQTAAVGLSISGLAYNPVTEHLFVMENSATDTITVLDVADSYNVIGSFNVAGFGSYVGAGLGFSCDGHLWAPNQGDGQVYEIDSGEGPACGAPEDTWINLVTWNTDQRGPQTFSQNVTGIIGAYNQAQFRFRYYAPGWDWWWEVDDVRLFDPDAPCEFIPGAMAEGFVTDANLGDAINGAMVAHDLGGSAMTMATPDDPGIPDGFYYLFTPMAMGGPSTRTFTASAPNYADSIVAVNMVPETVNELDFSLGAGWLEMTPHDMWSRLNGGMTENQAMDVLNWGTVEAHLSLLAFEKAAWMPNMPMDVIGAPTAPADKLDDGTAKASTMPERAPAAPLAAGDVLQSWGSGLASAWGVAYNQHSNMPWVGEGWGNDTIYEYTPSGTQTGTSYVAPWAPANGPGDYTFDFLTGMIWVMDIGTDNCLHELDPASGYTGNTLCWGASISERGVAYDALGDTFFVGGWNTLAVTRFDRDGNVLQVANVGLSISGLAYNPVSEHLFVIENSPTDTVTVLDPNDNYNVIGSFTIPGMGNYGGAGLGIACDGHLWVVNQTNEEVYEVDSGENGACLSASLPWLVLTPDQGTVPPMSGDPGDMPVNAEFIADGLDHYGLVQGWVMALHDTPYEVNDMQVCFTKAFNDVAPTFWADDYIHSLAGAEISQGCGSGNFCPTNLMIRNIMARWLVNAYHGPDFQPMVCAGTFSDVVCDQTPNSDYIEQIYADGITTGCSTDPLKFCPDDPVNRAQMATFITRLAYGPEFVPPPATGTVYPDVSAGYWAAPYIEWLTSEGVVEGFPDGTYRPLTNTTRAQMAKMVVISVGLPMCEMP